MPNCVSPELLRELLEYFPGTGELRWKRREARHFNDSSAQPASLKALRWNAQFAGKLALTARNKHGYRHGNVLGVYVQAHRAAWAICHGIWPELTDHINGIRSDNRIANLRSVSPRDNSRNQAAPLTNKSGAVGVYADEANGTWVAKISEGDGQPRTIGRYSTFEEAAAARKEAEHRLGYHPNHGREPASAA